MSEAQSLITKYRPKTFDDVRGHDAVINSLRRHVGSDTHSHGYLLTGASGLGKTTIARLIGNYFQAEILEIDAAEHGGVDEMRAMKTIAEHRSLTGAGVRMILIDECHTLSRNAWNAVLKILEEPPPHLYFALCTTEFGKVPDTIVQRCYHVVLRAVHVRTIEDLIDAVIQAEKWNIPGNVLTAVADNASGSPRKALSLLQVAEGVESIEELYRVIELQDASGAILDIARVAVKQLDWESVKKFYPRIPDDEFERASGALGRYILTVMLKSDEKTARRLWQLIEALTWPAASYDRKLLFMAALGRMMWGGN